MHSIASMLLLISVGLVSCTEHPSPTVPGTYAAKHSYGTELIHLNADGTFEQQFSFNSGNTVSNAGTWKGPATNGQMTMLHFIAFDDGFGTPRANPHPSASALVFEASGKQAVLRWNKDMGEPYRKQ